MSISLFGFVVLAVVLAYQSVLGQPGKIYSVSGRVVDASGSPLAGVDVNVAERGGFQVGATSTTTKDGKFEIPFPEPRERILYLYSSAVREFPHGHGYLISPPFPYLFSADKYFEGMPVTFGNANAIDVGDILVRYWFNHIHVKLTRAGRRLSESEWLRLWIRLKDRNGRIVYESSIAPVLGNEVDLDSSELRILLPEGEWSFDFQKYIYGLNQEFPEILGKTPSFVITRNTESPEIRVALAPF